MKRQAALVVIILATAILWRPVLRPIGAGTLIVAGIYSSALWDRNVVAFITPPPRIEDATERIAGTDMRITWWLPGWGDRHPALMLVNGATEYGNDDSETRRLGEALARAGYLVMLPEFPFLKTGSLERNATAMIDAAFARMAARVDTAGMARGAFGFSVGGGLLLAAASHGGALADAAYLGVLGGYFDLDVYLASVVSDTQRRNGSLEKWEADPRVHERFTIAAAQALTDVADRDQLIEALRVSGGRLSGEPPAAFGGEAASLWRALAVTDYDAALERLRALPPSLREVFVALSPRTAWSSLRVPVFWLHDVGDRFEPISEAENAAAATRQGATRLQRTALLSHAAALGAEAREKRLEFWVTELSGLLGFAAGALAAGG